MDANAVVQSHLRNEETGERLSAQVVIVADIDMPFWSMVHFMVKWAFAAIPAVVVLGCVGMFAWMIVKAVIGQTQQ